MSLIFPHRIFGLLLAVFVSLVWSSLATPKTPPSRKNQPRIRQLARLPRRTKMTSRAGGRVCRARQGHWWERKDSGHQIDRHRSRNAISAVGCHGENEGHLHGTRTFHPDGGYSTNWPSREGALMVTLRGRWTRLPDRESSKARNEMFSCGRPMCRLNCIPRNIMSPSNAWTVSTSKASRPTN